MSRIVRLGAHDRSAASYMTGRHKKMSPTSIVIGLELEPAVAAPPHLRMVESERTDAELVASAIAGHRAAEAALYKRHARTTAVVVTRLLGRTADAEDVLQDTFLTAFE